MSSDSARLPEEAEALLASAELDDIDWEQQALAIEARVQGVTVGSTGAELLDAPALVRDPDEPVSSPVSGPVSRSLSPSVAAATATPRPRSNATQLSDLARAVAQKSKNDETNALFKQSLSVAAAARVQPPPAPRTQPAKGGAVAPARAGSRAPLAPPSSGRPADAPRAAESARGSLGPFLAGAGVAIAAAAVVALVLRNPVPTEVVAVAPPQQQPAVPQPHPAERSPAPVEGSPGPASAPPATPAARAAAPREAAKPASEPLAVPSAATASTRPATPLKLAARSPATKAPAPERIVLEESSPAAAPPSGPSPVAGMQIASGSSNTMPDRPSAGAVQAALGSVLTAARACVAGTEGASSATVVFTASGIVARVTVSGPAAGTPAAGCIQSALGRARVSPFVQPTYVVNGIAIRP